jgi:hypothetical protein
MSKKRKGSTTTKNTKKNVYKVKSDYVPMLNKMESICKEGITDEDFAVLQTKVLTQSNEKTFEFIIEMLQSGVFSSQLDDIRIKLSDEYPIFKDKIMEREMFVINMFLTKSLMDRDTKTINEWSETFKRNPIEMMMKTLRFVEYVRNDSDISKSIKKLDKIVDWNS